MSLRERSNNGNMKLGRSGGDKSNRSLLGIPDRAEEKLAQQQNEFLLEKDNERKLDELAQTTSVIKGLVRDIESGIDTSNKNLSFLDKEMGDVQGLIGGAMIRLSNLTQQGGTRHMCYLILFVVFIFVLLYFIITRVNSVPVDTT